MKKLTLALGILILCTLTATLTMAATAIDTSFGRDGLSLQDFKLGNDEAYGIAVQEDGKILVTGYSSNIIDPNYSSNSTVKDLIVTRFLPDGALDPDFNDDGTYTYDLSGDTSEGRSLVVQKNDKIIIGGSSTYDGTARVTVLRLTPEGYPDTSFNTDGYVTLPVADGKVISTEVQLNATGSILVSATVATETSETSGDYAFFAKLDSDGQLDNSFSEDGWTTYRDGTNDIRINAITMLDDGKILSGGSFTEGSVTQAGLLRLNEDGTVDSSYAVGGKSLITADGAGSVIHSMVPGSDGSIIVAGTINNGEYNEAFVGKVKGDGTADADFGTSGIYKTTYSTENVAYGVTLQADNTISAVGFMTSQTGKDIFVLTLKDNTAGQTTAVTYITTDIAKNDDIAYAAAALENNMLLAAGSSSNGDDLDVALLRFAGDENLSSSTAAGSSRAGSTSGYRITTFPITEVTRVGAVSGGTIVDTTPGTCAQTCESQCGGTDNSCYTSCISTCADGITVTRRGVVYGTKPNPAYSEEETNEDNATETETGTAAAERDAAAEAGGSTGSIFPNSDSEGSIFPESITYSIVRLGNTDNGSGTGSYSSEINNITPGTLYYARAYAVLSNGEVIYGDEHTFLTDDACFIATAAYGSIFTKQVVLLRQFRDSYLLTNTAGQRFVALYYSFSPPIADIIRDNAALQTAVRFALLPAVLLALFCIKTSFMLKILCLATGLIFILFSRHKHHRSHAEPTG